MGEVGLSVLRFDGDDLETVALDGVGWVRLISLLRPFGKRVDNTESLLAGWARLRVARLGSDGEGNDFAHPSRKGVAGSDVTLIHMEDVPLAIARLDGRGMSEEIKAKHARYLQHVARVLAEHFGLRKPAPISDPWATIQAVAAGAMELKGRVDSVEQRLEATHRLAERAVAMAGSKGLLEAVAEATPAGRATEVPDGAFARRPRPGFKSVRSIAYDYNLPRVGEGALLVAKIAEALGLFDRPEFFHVQDVVIGGRVKNDHRTYGPEAIALLDKPLRAAFNVMVGLGYITTRGGALHAVMLGVKSKAWVLKQMFDGAVQAIPRPDVPVEQQEIAFEKAS